MDSRPHVKICGLTDPETADVASRLDVWAIGLVFASPSPRHVSVDRAADIASAIRPGIARVGVFVRPTIDELVEAVSRCDLTHVQIHGDEPDVATARAETGCEVITGHPVDGPEALDRARRSPADLVLLDASVRGRHGGTGRVFDWDLLTEGIGRRYILAGGLTPENVEGAVAEVSPWGVDVSTGVESSPGRKDIVRVTAFVEAARGMTREGAG